MVDENDIGCLYSVEGNSKRICPELIVVCGISNGEVTKESFREPGSTEDSACARQALSEVSPMIVKVFERRWGRGDERPAGLFDIGVCHSVCLSGRVLIRFRNRNLNSCYDV